MKLVQLPMEACQVWMVVNGRHEHQNICHYSSHAGHDHGAYSAELHKASPGTPEIAKISG